MTFFEPGDSGLVGLSASSSFSAASMTIFSFALASASCSLRIRSRSFSARSWMRFVKPSVNVFAYCSIVEPLF